MTYTLNIGNRDDMPNFMLTVEGSNIDQLKAGIDAALANITDDVPADKPKPAARKDDKPKQAAPKATAKSKAKPEPDDKPADDNAKADPEADPAAELEATRKVLQRYIDAFSTADAKQLLQDEFSVTKVKDIDPGDLPRLRGLMGRHLEGNKDGDGDLL